MPSRKVVQLTHQERTPNTGARARGASRIRAASTTWRPARSPAARSCSSAIATVSRRARADPGRLAAVRHGRGRQQRRADRADEPRRRSIRVPLKDGRVMFSSLETQGLRSDEQWGIWAIHPDGTNWGPLTSALGLAGGARQFISRPSSPMKASWRRVVLPDRFHGRLRHLLEVPVADPGGAAALCPAARGLPRSAWSSSRCLPASRTCGPIRRRQRR